MQPTPYPVGLLLALLAGCGEREQHQASAAPADPCALERNDLVDSEMRAALQRCTGVVPSDLDSIQRSALGEEGSLVGARVASNASRGTDAPPADVLVAWVTRAPPQIREQNGGYGSIGKTTPDRNFVGTSTFSGKQVIIDENTLNDGVLTPDPLRADAPPAAPTVSPR